MSSLNKIILVGNLVAEPEQRTTNSGDPFSRFTLAVDRPVVHEDTPAQTDFVTVVAWRDLAQQTTTYTKGQQVLVDGRIITRTYDDDDGRRHYVTEVEAKTINVFSKLGAPAVTVASSAPATPAMPSEPTPAQASTPTPTEPLEVPTLESKPADPIEDADFSFDDSALSTDEIEEDIPF